MMHGWLCRNSAEKAMALEAHTSLTKLVTSAHMPERSSDAAMGAKRCAKKGIKISMDVQNGREEVLSQFIPLW